MMLRLMRPAVFAVFALAASACDDVATSNTGGAMGTMGEVTVSEADNGKEVTLAVGQKLVVKLTAQFGTGYSWALVGDAGPQFAVTDAGTASGGGAPGAPEAQTFAFEARAPGTRDLQFAYRRPFEQGTPPAKTFSIKATVTPS